MSVREGFLRIEVLYWRRWWLLIVAPAVMFAYRLLEQPAPFGMHPAVWLAAKAILLGAASMMTLALIAWLILGFIAPPAAWELQLEPARKPSSRNEPDAPNA
ncbi:MAG: hypothetical protein NT015_12275 [Alphaproteobacteria bacterium]|nr:hypothetical protein [Alphaproteobacteria bacterium]